MKDIRLVDLMGQYEKISTEIDAAILDVVRSSAYINGPEVSAFALDLQQYLSVSHVIPCANGTDALQIALMSLGLQAGDEVVTPSFTYIATAEVIALLGLKPVFAEVDPQTFVMTAETFADAITPGTKAVIPVHLYGQCADMEGIIQLASERGIAIIEDTAQALGAAYTFSDGSVKKAGTMGDIGCTSFFPSKNLGCYGDGGALMTQNAELAHTIAMIANHGQEKKYYHDKIGVNSRLDSIQAAILRVKLRYLDKYTKARQNVAARYDMLLKDLPGIGVPARAHYSTHVFHQYTLKINGLNRDRLLQHLSDKHIPSNIYYPLPIHKQKGFTDRFGDQTKLPVTEKLCSSVISLPIHTEMPEEQTDYIASAISHFVQEEPSELPDQTWNS